METAITMLSRDEIADIVKGAMIDVMEKMQSQSQVEEELPKNEKMLTDKELAQRLNISRVSLWKLRKEQKVKYYKVNGKLLYNYSEVLDSLNKYGDKGDE